MVRSLIIGNFLELYLEIPSISQEFTCWLFTLCGNSNGFGTGVASDEADPAGGAGRSGNPRGESELKINCFLI